MAFTYDVSTNIGKVRLLIGDTDDNDILLQDEEIDFFITEHGNIKIAASHAAMAISAKFSKEADKRVGNLSINLSSRADKYEKLSNKLKSNASSLLVGYAGGISESDKTVNTDNVDRVTPAFKRGMMKNSYTGSDENGQST